MAHAAKNMRLLLPTALWDAESPMPHSISCVAALPPQPEDPDAHLRLLLQHALPPRELNPAASETDASRAEKRGGTVWTGGEDGGIVVWQLQEALPSPSAQNLPPKLQQESPARPNALSLEPIALLCGHHVGISALVPCSSRGGGEASPQLGSSRSSNASGSSSATGGGGSQLRDGGTSSPGAPGASISGGASKAASSTLNWPSSSQRGMRGAASISAAQAGVLEGGWGPPSVQARQPHWPQPQSPPVPQERGPQLGAEGVGPAGVRSGLEQDVLDRLVSVCWQGTMCLWDGRTRKCRRRRRLPPWVGVPTAAQALPHDPSLLCIAANEVAAVAPPGTQGRSSAPPGPSSLRSSLDRSSMVYSPGSKDPSEGERQHPDHEAHSHGFVVSASAPSLGHPADSRGRASAPSESTTAIHGTESWAHVHVASVSGRMESRPGAAAAAPQRPSEGFKLSVVLVHAATLNLMQVVEQGLVGQCPVASMRLCLPDPGSQWLQQRLGGQPGGLGGSPAAAPDGEARFALVLCNSQGEVRTWPSLHMSEQKQPQHLQRHQPQPQHRHSEGQEALRPHAQQNGTARRSAKEERPGEPPVSHAHRKHLHGHTAPLVCNLPLLEHYSQMRAGLALDSARGATPYPISVSVGPAGDFFLVVFASHFVLLAASGTVLAAGGPGGSARGAAAESMQSTGSPFRAPDSGHKGQATQEAAAPWQEGGFLSSMRAPLGGGMFLAAPMPGDSGGALSSEESQTSSILFLLWNTQGAALVYQLRPDGRHWEPPPSPGAGDGHFTAPIGDDLASPAPATCPWMDSLLLISVIPPAVADSPYVAVAARNCPLPGDLERNKGPSKASDKPLSARGESSGDTTADEATMCFRFWQMAEPSANATLNSIVIVRATSSSAEAERRQPGQGIPTSLHVWRCPLPAPPADSPSSSAGPQSPVLGPSRAEDSSGCSGLWWLPPRGRLWAAPDVAQMAAQASLGDAWSSSTAALKGAASGSKGAAAGTPHLPAGSAALQSAAPGSKPGGQDKPEGQSRAAVECTCAVTHVCLVGTAEGGLGPGLLARAHACGNIEARPLLDVGPRPLLLLRQGPDASNAPESTPPTHVWLQGHEGAVLCLAEHAMPASAQGLPSGRGARLSGAAPSRFPKEGAAGTPDSKLPDASEKADAAMCLRRVLISGGNDWAVRIWDLADIAKAEAPAQLPGRRANALVGEERVEVGGCGAQLDPKGLRRPLAVLRHHVGPVRQIVLPPAAAAAISAQFSPLGLQSSSATSAKASASANSMQGTSMPSTLPPWLYCFLTLAEDGTIAVCSLLTLRCERLLPGHPCVPRDVLWDVGRGYLAALCRPHPMAAPPATTSASGHVASAIPSSTASSVASLAPSGPPSPSSQSPPQPHQAGQAVLPAQQGPQGQPSGAGRKLRGRRRSSRVSSTSLNSAASVSGSSMGVLQERASSVGNSGPDEARRASTDDSSAKSIFELPRRESEESLECPSPGNDLEKDAGTSGRGSAVAGRSPRTSDAANPAAADAEEDNGSTAPSTRTWPAAWEKVREFSSSSPMDVLFVWDVHSGARERYLRSAPAHSLYSFFHIRMRNAAAPATAAAASVLNEQQSAGLAGAWAGPAPSPFALEDIVWSDGTQDREVGGASAASGSEALQTAAQSNDSASSTLQGGTPGATKADGVAEGGRILGTPQAPKAAAGPSGGLSAAAEPALGRSPSRMSLLNWAEGQGRGPVGYKVRVGDIGGTSSVAGDAASTGQGVCIVGSKTIVVTPILEKAARGQYQPNAEKAQADLEPEPGLGVGLRPSPLPSSSAPSGRFSSVAAMPTPVPGIRGQCVLPSVAALTIDALHLLSYHWGPPRVYPGLGVRQRGQQPQQHAPLSPAALRAIEVIADAAADAALPPVSPEKGWPSGNPASDSQDAAQARAAARPDGTGQQEQESGDSLNGTHALGATSALDLAQSSSGSAVNAAAEQRERERVRAHVRNEVLQQLLLLQGSQARALRNSLRLLCCWALHPDLDRELDALLGLRLPQGISLGPGLLGDKGALTFALPGPAASAEMLRSSAEFTALRSLAVVATAQRLAQLLPHPVPLAPLEAPPSDAGSASLPQPTALVAFSPPSAHTTCQRLATYYSSHLLDKIGSSAPPSLEIFACFWQDSVPQVRAAARVLFHYSAARALPQELQSPSFEAPASTSRTGPPHAALGAPAKPKQPGSAGLFPEWGGWECADISRWVESEAGYELVSAVGGTVYDAQSARTNVAAALAVWYLPPGRNDLAVAVAPSLLSLVRAASSRHSATAAEILAEGMTSTWQPLIGPQIPRLIADVFLLCEALQGSWADTVSSASWGALAAGPVWAGPAGTSKAAPDSGAGAGRQWTSPPLSSQAHALRLVSPSMAHHTASQIQRSPSDLGSFALDPSAWEAASRSYLGSPGSSMPHLAHGASFAPAPPQPRASSGAPGPGSPDGARQSSGGGGAALDSAGQFQQAIAGDGGSAPAAGVAVVVKETLAAVLLPALAMADFHAFLSAVQNLQSGPSSLAPPPPPGQGSKGGPGTGLGAAGSMSSAAAGLALASGATSVHLTALMAAIRTMRSHPRTVLLHLPELVDWAMRCIDPANASLRASCIHTVMALLLDLPHMFPMVALFQSGSPAAAAASRPGRAPGTPGSTGPAAAEAAAQSPGASGPGQQLLRLAVGEALNDASKLCIHVYDLSTATKFRVLDASLPAGHPAVSSVSAPTPSPQKAASPTGRGQLQKAATAAGGGAGAGVEAAATVLQRQESSNGSSAPLSRNSSVSSNASTTSSAAATLAAGGAWQASSLSLGCISAVAFSPSGDTLVAFSQLGMLLRWWSLGMSWWERLMLSRSAAVLTPVHCTRLVLVPPLPPLLPDLLSVVTEQLQQQQQQTARMQLEQQHQQQQQRHKLDAGHRHQLASFSSSALFPAPPSSTALAQKAAHSSMVSAAVQLLDLNVRLEWPQESNTVVLLHQGVELSRY